MARPREFDINEALSNAMSAFWSQGYEATSMTDLMEAMGLQKGSIYKAFGDKHNLYLQSLKHYLDKTLDYHREKLEDVKRPKQAIKEWLAGGIGNCCANSVNRGCLMINAISELSNKDSDVQVLTKDHINSLHQLLTATIRLGQTNEEIRTDIPAKDLANLIIVNLIGILTLAKSGLSESENQKNIKNLLKLLD